MSGRRDPVGERLIALVVLTGLIAFTSPVRAQQSAPPPSTPAVQPTTSQVPPTSAPGPVPPAYVPPVDPRDEMDAAVDLGLGLFEFIHLDISWLISRRWVVGVELGMFPIDWLLRKAMGVDDLSGQVAVAGFEMEGGVETKLGSGAIFGRWFPTRKKKLFLEGALGVWRLDATVTGTLDHEELPEQLEVKVNAKVWVPMVGVHLGWRFLFKKGPFIDLGFGANVMLSPGAEVTFGGATVAQISEYEQAAAMLDLVQGELSSALEDGANRVAQKSNKIFPTGYLRFGWAFDLW